MRPPTLPYPCAANDRAPTRTWNVGRPNATNMMALARFKLWWMMPKHSTKANEVPPETQMMLTKLPPGKPNSCVCVVWYDRRAMAVTVVV